MSSREVGEQGDAATSPPQSPRGRRPRALTNDMDSASGTHSQLSLHKVRRSFSMELTAAPVTPEATVLVPVNPLDLRNLYDRAIDSTVAMVRERMSGEARGLPVANLTNTISQRGSLTHCR